jgi:hypothetical protein
MTRFLLLLAVLSSVAFGQVAGLCGAGRPCNVTKLTTARSSTSNGSVCLKGGPTYDWGLNTVNSDTIGLYSYTAGSGCTAGPGAFYTFTAAALTGNSLISANPFGTGSAGSGTAFASFPAASSWVGRLLFDSTNSVWRYSRSGLWLTFSPTVTDTMSVYVPAAAVTNNPLAQWSWQWGNNSLEQNTTIAVDRAVVLTTGVGAGNITYSVFDVTGAAVTTAAVTLACTAAVGSVTVGAGDLTLRALPRLMELRVTASACTTNPVVNVTLRTAVQ